VDGDHQVGGIVTLEDVLVLLGEERYRHGEDRLREFCGNRSQQTRRGWCGAASAFGCFEIPRVRVSPGP
jgi:hypothetical protein